MIGSESLTEANYLYYAFGLAQELASTLEPAGFSHAELQKATYIQTKREGITDEFEFDEIYCMPDAIREALDKSKDRTVCITK